MDIELDHERPIPEVNEIRKSAMASERASQPDLWTVAALVQSMEARGDDPAILFVREGRQQIWSYRDLADLVWRLAEGLCQAGLASGESAALLGPNGPEWIAIALALNTVGALLVPIDDLAEDQRTSSVIRSSGVKWIFTTRSHLPALRRMPASDAFRIYLLDATNGVEQGSSSLLSLRATQRSAVPNTGPEQPACLFYTSGTTGPPKGFVLTHANIGANVRALAAERIVWSGDRALIPLPLHHAYPYVVGMLTSLQTGVTIVLPQSSSGPHIAQSLQDAHVSVIIGVPRLYEALLSGLEARLAARGWAPKHLFSALLAICRWIQQHAGLPAGRWLLRPVRRQIGRALRLLVSGGARLEEDLSWKLEALGWQTLAGYGLAETASVFTANLPRQKRLGSAGVPLGDGQVRISGADEKGIGEIELLGRSVAAGYRDNPEANLAAFTKDGWFRTGDLGYVDRDCFLFVTGRKKEVIVLGGGKKVNPEELEKTYSANPLIAEIAVLERGGQLVGLVRPNPERLHEIGTLNAEHAVRVALAEVGQKIPAYERLAGFAIATRPLPRTRLGKYQRFLLPNLYAGIGTGPTEASPPQISVEDQQLLADPIAAGAWNLVLARYAKRRPSLDAHLALDLGVDSLEWMGLSLELDSKLHVFIPQDEMARVETVRDLLRATAKCRAMPLGRSQTLEERRLSEQDRWLRPRGFILKLVGSSLFAFNKILMRMLFRLRTQGLERLPESGPFVLAPNHVSDLDPLAIAASLSFARLRRVYWAGDLTRLFTNRILRLLCRAVHLFPVDERMPDSATEMAEFVLSRGDIQVWFPEGWRSPDGRLQVFRPGIGSLLLRSSAMAVPVYISGTFSAMPRDRHWPQFHPIRVVIGAPVKPETLQLRGQGSNAEERVANALRAEVRALAATIGEDV